MTIRTIAKELSRPGDGKTGKVCVSSNKLAIILHSICVFITHCILRSFRNCFWGTFFSEMHGRIIRAKWYKVCFWILFTDLLLSYLNLSQQSIRGNKLEPHIHEFKASWYFLSQISVIYFLNQRSFQSITWSGPQAFDRLARDAEGVARSRCESKTGVWRG